MHRLRQICLVAESLDDVIPEITEVLALEEGYIDEGVSRWGLENRVIPLGYDFLEVVAPCRAGTAAGRYLERRKGPGGYMVILQTDDGLRHRKRITDMGIRTVFTADREPDIWITQYHPSDCGGILLEIDAVNPAQDYEADLCSWPPAGADWQRQVKREVTEGFSAIEIQDDNPMEMAQLWSDLLDMPVFNRQGVPQIKLLNSAVRFVETHDDRGTGLSLLELRMNNRGKALEMAEARGLRKDESTIGLCGTPVRLIE